MKTSRMIEIIYLLLEKRHRTSKELAKHFNVSTKTIYRDVEELINAGIPISMQQGINGGVVLSEDYLVKQSRFTKLEEEILLKALAEIKKLPNAKLDYALNMLHQYFNEAATLWVSTDDICLNIQEKFHAIKKTIIESNVVDFQYYNGKEFDKYHCEPYELRIGNGVWKVIIRNIENGRFEELFLSRIKNIEVKSKRFKRRDLPDGFARKFTGNIKEVQYEVLKLTDEILNTFPIEAFIFEGSKTYLNIYVKEENNISESYSRSFDLKIVEQ